MYRRFQNDVLRAYLHGKPVNKDKHSFLLNTAPYEHRRLKQRFFSKVERTVSNRKAEYEQISREPDSTFREEKRYRVAKIVMWIIVAVIFSIALISQL